MGPFYMLGVPLTVAKILFMLSGFAQPCHIYVVDTQTIVDQGLFDIRSERFKVFHSTSTILIVHMPYRQTD